MQRFHQSWHRMSVSVLLIPVSCCSLKVSLRVRKDGWPLLAARNAPSKRIRFLGSCLRPTREKFDGSLQSLLCTDSLLNYYHTICNASAVCGRCPSTDERCHSLMLMRSWWRCRCRWCEDRKHTTQLHRRRGLSGDVNMQATCSKAAVDSSGTSEATPIATHHHTNITI